MKIIRKATWKKYSLETSSFEIDPPDSGGVGAEFGRQPGRVVGMEVGEEVVAAVGVEEAEGVHHELGHRTRRSCYAFPNQQNAFQKKRFQKKQFL